MLPSSLQNQNFQIRSVNVTGSEYKYQMDSQESKPNVISDLKSIYGDAKGQIFGDMSLGSSSTELYSFKTKKDTFPSIKTSFSLDTFIKDLKYPITNSSSYENTKLNFVGNIVIKYEMPDVLVVDTAKIKESLNYDKERLILNEDGVKYSDGTLTLSFKPRVDNKNGNTETLEYKDKENALGLDEMLKCKFFTDTDYDISFDDGISVKDNIVEDKVYTIKSEIGGSTLISTITEDVSSARHSNRNTYSIFTFSQLPSGVNTYYDNNRVISTSFSLKKSGSTYIPGKDPDRIDGVDRVETAVNVSKETYPNGANAVILANKNKFSDVLTAVPLSVQIGAPILFTNTDTLPQETKDEIARLNPSTIYINGGTESVAKAIETNLSNSGKSVTRFNGVDRYHTAKLIAEKIREKGDKRVVEIASGETFPDALSISSLAVKENAPILLSKKNDLTKYTKSALATWDVDKATIAGQTETISNTVQGLVTSGFSVGDTKNPDNVFNGAKDTRRIGGADRYETSTKIAEYTLPDATFGVYASGQVFADSLIAGPYAAVNKAPVLLVKRDAMPNSVQDYTKKSKINKAKLIGGENTVNNNVLNLLKSLVANKK